MKASKIALGLAMVGGLLVGCAQQTEQPAPDATPPATTTAGPTARTLEEQIEYGRYLVEIGGCHDCHSPKVMTEMGPVPDPNRLLSGHIAEEKLAPVADPSVLQGYVLFNMNLTAGTGPWGTSYAANLTPDETGTGNWTYENFERALREGKLKGLENGRPLLPPMPWPNLRHMKDEDMRAIWTYLQSLPPIRNLVPAPIPPAAPAPQVG